MIIQPMDYFLVGWFTLAWVMRVAFILVTLYMGPFGLLLYVLADKEGTGR